MSSLVAVMALWVFLGIGLAVAAPCCWLLYRWAGGKKSLWRYLETL